jgi:hypothetical protein
MELCVIWTLLLPACMYAPYTHTCIQTHTHTHTGTGLPPLHVCMHALYTPHTHTHKRTHTERPATQERFGHPEQDVSSRPHQRTHVHTVWRLIAVSQITRVRERREERRRGREGERGILVVRRR